MKENKIVFRSITIRRYLFEKLKKKKIRMSPLFRQIIDDATEEELKNFNVSQQMGFRINSNQLLKLAKANPKNLSGFLEHKIFEYLEKEKYKEKKLKREDNLWN